MIKKIILGTGIFVLLSGTALAEYRNNPQAREISPAFIEKRMMENIKPALLNKCLAQGISREDCLKKIKNAQVRPAVAPAVMPKAVKVEAQQIKAIRAERPQIAPVRILPAEKALTNVKPIKAEVKKAKILPAEIRKIEAQFKNKMQNAKTEADRIKIRKEFAEIKNKMRAGVGIGTATVVGVGGGQAISAQNNPELFSRNDWIERAKKSIAKRFNILIKKYQAYQKRAESVSQRLNKKIIELEKQGFDVSKLRKLQIEAKERLVIIDKRITAAKQKVEELLKGKYTIPEIRKIVKNIRNDLREAKKALKDFFSIVREIIKEIRNLNKPSIDSSDNIAE